jgi:excisionase family DNA binding protein
VEHSTTEPVELGSPVVMTVEQAAKYVGVGRSTMFEIVVRDGLIPSFKIGRLRKIRRVDVDRWIDKRAESGDR